MRRNDGRAIPAFIGQALTGKDITIFGDGKQTRSFCYISDLVDGVFKLIESDYHLPLNIGNPTELTILKLANKINKLAGGKSKLIYQERPTDDPLIRKPDISKAKRILAWEPYVKLDKGLYETISWYKSH